MEQRLVVHIELKTTDVDPSQNFDADNPLREAVRTDVRQFKGETRELVHNVEKLGSDLFVGKEDRVWRGNRLQHDRENVFVFKVEILVFAADTFVAPSATRVAWILLLPDHVICSESVEGWYVRLVCNGVLDQNVTVDEASNFARKRHKGASTGLGSVALHVRGYFNAVFHIADRVFVGGSSAVLAKDER